MSKIKDFVTRLDSLYDGRLYGGWTNQTTGVGVHGVDKTADWEYCAPSEWSVSLLSQLLTTDSLAAKAVGCVVEEALGDGYQLLDAEGSPDAGKRWLDRAEELFGFSQKLKQILIESRGYGGVAVVPLTNDPGDLTAPLGQVSQINSIHWAEPDSAHPLTWDRDPTSPTFGRPIDWQVVLTFPGGGLTVSERLHSSRVLPVLGGVWTRRERSRRKYWPRSVLTPAVSAILQYRAAMRNSGVLVSDMSQAIYKVAGLKRMISKAAGAGAEDLKAWMQLQDRLRSTLRALVIDAGTKDTPGEDFTRVATPLSDIPNLLDRFALGVSEVLDMPVTKLFGMSPAGLSTDDLSGQKNWNRKVDNYRTSAVEPLLRALVGLLSRDARMPELPEGWTVEWPSLWTFTPIEEAAAKLTVAQADAVYIDRGAVSAEAVHKVRAQPDGWRLDLVAEEPDLFADLPGFGQDADAE
jgi:uncharacterized protein